MSENTDKKSHSNSLIDIGRETLLLNNFYVCQRKALLLLGIARINLQSISGYMAVGHD